MSLSSKIRESSFSESASSTQENTVCVGFGVWRLGLGGKF